MVICGDSLHRYRGGIFCHDHWDRRGFLFSLSMRNRYDFAYRFLSWLFVLAFLLQYRGGVICHDNWDRMGFLFSISIRNRYDFAHRFLKWLFVVALYIKTEVASYAMITWIEGASFSL